MELVAAFLRGLRPTKCQANQLIMPACAVEQNDGMAVGRDDASDLGEVQVHRLGVGLGQDERGAEIARGTDRAEQIGPIVALIARRAWPAAALGPDAGQRPLLADARFVLPPQFDRLALRMRRDAGRDQIGEVFLCASWAAPSCSGQCGRTDMRRKPRRRSRSPTDRSASVTP